MTEGTKDSYIGLPQPNGGIKMEGPMTHEQAMQRMKEEPEDQSVVHTRAQKPGEAILNIIGTILGNEKSKSK